MTETISVQSKGFEGLIRLREAMTAFQYGAAVNEVTCLAKLVDNRRITTELNSVLHAAIDDLNGNDGYPEKSQKDKFALFGTTSNLIEKTFYDEASRQRFCQQLLEQIPDIFQLDPRTGLKGIVSLHNHLLPSDRHKVVPLVLDYAEAVAKIGDVSSVEAAVDANLLVIQDLDDTDPLYQRAIDSWKKHFDRFYKIDSTRDPLNKARDAVKTASKGSRFSLNAVDIIFAKLQEEPFKPQGHRWLDCFDATQASFGVDNERYELGTTILESQLSLAVNANPNAGMSSRFQAYKAAEDAGLRWDLPDFMADRWVNDIQNITERDHNLAVAILIKVNEKTSRFNILSERIGEILPVLMEQISSEHGLKKSFGVATHILETIGTNAASDGFGTPLHTQTVLYMLEQADAVTHLSVSQLHERFVIAAQLDGSDEPNTHDRAAMAQLKYSRLMTEDPDERLKEALDLMHTYRFNIETRREAGRVALLHADAGVRVNGSRIRSIEDAIRSTEDLPDIISQLRKKLDSYKAALPPIAPTREETAAFVEWVRSRQDRPAP